MYLASSRRAFLKTSGLLAASAFTGLSFKPSSAQPKLSFSTLGCPDWDFETIVAFAAKHGYAGIEVRGINRQLDLPLAAPFNSPAARANTVALMKDKGLAFAGLGASANLHFPQGAERTKNLEEARRFIDLAAAIQCPYVRVFPNRLPKEQDKQATLELIGSGLVELANYSTGTGVSVLLETHGDVVNSADLQAVMQQVSPANTGLIWDISNMWTVTKEAPTEVYARLKPYIRHVHIKDALMVDGKLQYQLPGKGEVPIFTAVDALRNDGYGGYYSFEWEKLWHPEIEEPETALARYPAIMRAHFKR